MEKVKKEKKMTHGLKGNCDCHPHLPPELGGSDKVKGVTKNKVELISYSIKMVIPTGQYANVQPEIVVKSGSLEDAHAYIAPHMNKLWKEYFMVSERRPEPTVNQVSKPVAVDSSPATNPVPPPPASSSSFIKASQAIRSCMSLDALELIKKQIELSTKLTESDKYELIPVLDGKFNDFVR